jgi:hypothetical protein
MFSRKKLKHIFKISIVFVNLFFSFQAKLLAQNSSAFNNIRNTTGNDCKTYDEKKSVKGTCYTSEYSATNEQCIKNELKFDPFGTNDDLEWNYGNQSCLGFMAGAGTALEAAFIGCRVLCPSPAGIGDPIRELAKSNFHRTVSTIAKPLMGAGNSAGSAASGGMPVGPMTGAELMTLGYRCVMMAPVGTNPCCIALYSCGAATGTAIGILGGMWGLAKEYYNNVHICGRGWKVWKNDEDEYSKNGVEKKVLSDGIYKKALGLFSETKSSGVEFKGADTYCSTNAGSSVASKRFCDNSSYFNISSNIITKGTDFPGSSKEKREYREFLYQGIEYIDESSNACLNPKDEDSSTTQWKNFLGYEGGNQRYYFRGSGQMPNFACSRFLQGGRKDLEGLKAFTCCNEKSQNTICLEGTDFEHKFCRVGEDCTAFLAGNRRTLSVKYKIFESEANPGYICAKTYTACPYDHNVQGGTDVSEEYVMNPRIRTNFCQYMNHCTKLPPSSKYNYFDPDTFFLAESCQDLVGDSQFVSKSQMKVTNKIPTLNSRNFSAPMIQCFKETLENNFLQKEGMTICNDRDEKPI